MTEVRVCQDIYPKGWSHNTKPGFALELTLKENIDILVKNVANDWDFTILVTGGGEVRVGKSVLAMQIAAYWKQQIKEIYGIDIPFDEDKNMVFDGKELIKKGNYLGKNHTYAPLIYDEAGADLEGRKAVTQMTKDVLDYYRECGQYNLLNILVLPEFFDLPKGIALSRSIFLIDVYYTATDDGFFKRGYFNFYSRPNKKWLYLKGKKELNYKAYQWDFHGRFYEFYPINEKAYRAKKQVAMMKRESKRRNKFQLQRDWCWYILHKEFGWTLSLIGKRMEQGTRIYVAKQTISDGIRSFIGEE